MENSSKNKETITFVFNSTYSPIQNLSLHFTKTISSQHLIRRPRHSESFSFHNLSTRYAKRTQILMGMTRNRENNSSEEWVPNSSHKKEDIRRSRDLDQSRENMELNWRFSTQKNEGPKICKKCRGTGRIECSWCHATGVLMLGDRLMCSTEGQCHCLACDNGEVVCKACKGTGKLASWMTGEL